MSQKLRDEINDLTKKLDARKKELKQVERSCRHNWGETVYDPIYQEGYYIPSDIEQGINLGVDTRVSGTHVPSKNTRRWKRQCLTCGCIQFTESTKKTSQFGTAGCSVETESPDFSTQPNNDLYERWYNK